ncbi:transcription factor JunB-like isoform X1 [Sebastes fasciatus]|uniref:transcription factor JunB-like isoform X1 n=2 Tax=Sebastes fasciatus TaxID=394691 RepID=UPI003D9DF624
MSTIMEQPFYDDSFLSAYGHPGAALPDYKLLKQNMNLNFSDSYRNSNFKSQHLNLNLHHLHHHRAADSDFYSAGSTTADVSGSLKLASPELERLIIQNSNGVITTTPTPAAQFLYNRGITEEQEGFADGFVKALDDLHKMNQMAPPPNVSLGGGCGLPGGGVVCSAPGASVFGSSMQPEGLEYTTLSSCTTTNPSLSSGASYPSTTISYLPHHHQYHHHQHPQALAAHGSHHFQHSSLAGVGIHSQRFAGGLKEEPQTVPDMLSSDGSPPMSPIDMENQDRMKTERKRLRNRLAASKCRRRKLERISRLEDKVKVLKTDNAGLSNTASVLRDQVAQLKQKVMTHVSSGCQLMLAPKVKSY